MNAYIEWAVTGSLVAISACISVLTIVGTTLFVREILRDFRK